MRLISRYLFAFILFAISLHAAAQPGPQQKYNTVFRSLEKYINGQHTDSIYALASDAYKASVAEQHLHAFMEKEIYPLGKIIQSSWTGAGNDTARYKLRFAAVKLELSFSLDANGRFNFLLFMPYKAPITQKVFRAASNNPLRSAIDRQVDTLARLYIQQSNTVGLSIGIVKDGKTFTYGYGSTEKGKDKLPDANTIFEIGSLTKTFTATILAYSVNEGKLRLTDPITQYLPDSVAANTALQKIKIRDLSNHTSGLPRLPGNFFNEHTDQGNPYKNYTKALLFADLVRCKPQSAPGAVYAYSNYAAGLLGVILERVNGKPYEQLVKEIITGPLNMNSTVQQLTPQLRNRFTKVYDADGDLTSAWDFNALAGCGSLHASVNDLLLYAESNMDSKDTPLAKALELTHQVTFFKGPVVGLGWHITMINGSRYYWHNGGTGGSRSILLFNIEKHTAVVLLSNADQEVDTLGRQIVEKLTAL